MGAVGVCCCWSLELPANAKRQDKPAVFSKAGENPTVYFQPGTGKGVERGMQRTRAPKAKASPAAGTGSIWSYWREK